MAKYNIKIDAKMCVIDKSCEIINTVNKMFNEKPIHKECDYPLTLTVEFDDSNLNEKQIKEYLNAVADNAIKKIKEQPKTDNVWLKEIKLNSISKEIL